MTKLLSVTKEAADSYKQELNLQAGDVVRLFVQVGGMNRTPVPGFAFGVQKVEAPGQLELSEHHVKAHAGDITFLIHEDELWCLNGRQLTICRNGLTEEIQFVYLEPYLTATT